MPKPDPALLDPARYPVFMTVESRYADLDTNGHINNVAMVTYLEHARVRVQMEGGVAVSAPGLGTMVASLAVEFIGQSHYPAPLTVHTALEDIGRTSVRYVQVVTQDGRSVAFARTVMVLVGQEGPVPLPEGFRRYAEDRRLRA